MTIHFDKYHGAGNDFIIVDNRESKFSLNSSMINNMCMRHFGIGADGLIEILDDETDFYMRYYNADGQEGTMCGNGGRCAAAFAFTHNISTEKMSFKTIDGVHQANIVQKEPSFKIQLSMNDIEHIDTKKDHFFIDTGSPHYVKFLDKINEKNFLSEAKTLRHNYRKGGTNVNFVVQHDNHLDIRTFERGVEAETLACGTGVTASALAAALRTNMNKGDIKVNALGGQLKVYFERMNQGFSNIWLEGPAQLVFKGQIELKNG